MRRYFELFGGSRADLTRYIVDNRANALRNTNAYWQSPLSADDYAQSRILADPISMLDCDIPVDGCAALLLTSTERARDLRRPPALLTGFAASTHTGPSGVPMILEDMRAGWGIRGLAYKDGKIFVGTREGRLIAVNAKTGKLIWSVETLDDAEFGYISGPPWVAGNKVVIGFGGAEYEPVRGYVTAYDINTGKKAWRFYTIPGDPSKGFEDKAQEIAAKTWSGDWWKLGGGGTVWHAMLLGFTR